MYHTGKYKVYLNQVMPRRAIWDFVILGKTGYKKNGKTKVGDDHLKF